MLKQSMFITAALESLKNETEAVQLAPQPAIAETNVNTDNDVVAQLMEKNTQLDEVVVAKESEEFDNDTDIIQSTSDSINQDLEEVVHAGAALEELANIIDMSIRAGQVNKATNASWAHALETYSYFGGIDTNVAALESAVATTDDPGEHAKTLGETAKNKAAEIVKKLAEGIKRIAGWALNILRNFFARSKQLAEKAKLLGGRVNEIDESKTIDAEVFIASLRLVEGGGDPNKQFEDYGHFSAKGLYGFFNNSFTQAYADAMKELKTADGYGEEAVNKVTHKVIQIIKVLMSTLYPEHGNISDVNGAVPSAVETKDLTVSLTKPCIGGLQLALAATLDVTNGKDTWFCKSGPAKTQPKIDVPTSVPVVSKKLAQDYLALIQQWMRDQSILEENVKTYQAVNVVDIFSGSPESLRRMLSVLTTIMSGCMPYLLRLNIQNSANFIAYVERSLAASKAAPKAAE